jgi:hypothetical protein
MKDAKSIEQYKLRWWIFHPSLLHMKQQKCLYRDAVLRMKRCAMHWVDEAKDKVGYQALRFLLGGISY